MREKHTRQADVKHFFVCLSFKMMQAVVSVFDIQQSKSYVFLHHVMTFFPAMTY